MITLDAVVLGGGVGSRFRPPGGSQPGLPKQFQILGNAPVFIHAVRSFLAMGCFRQIVLAMPRDYISLTEELVDTYLTPQSQTLIRIVAGGERRQDSSRLALEAVEKLNPLPTRVLIHDASRPFLTPGLLARAKDCLFDRSYGAWVPVVPPPPDRPGADLQSRIQTPQIFEYTVIRPLVEKVKDDPSLNFTDDASLCEYYGIPVGVFEGDARNAALTYDFDMEALRAQLTEEATCEPESDTTFTA